MPPRLQPAVTSATSPRVPEPVPQLGEQGGQDEEEEGEEWAALLKQMPVPPFTLWERSEDPLLWFRAMLAPDAAVLAFTVTLHVAGRLIKV